MNVSTVKEIVDENEQLKVKYNELLKTQKEMEQKTLMYKRRTARLQRLTALTVNKLRKLKEKNTTIKDEKDLMSAVFSPAQIDVLLGVKNVKWSEDDLASAFTLRHIGGRECYLYLKDNLNIPLPSLSCVQTWAASSV